MHLVSGAVPQAADSVSLAATEAVAASRCYHVSKLLNCWPIKKNINSGRKGDRSVRSRCGSSSRRVWLVTSTVAVVAVVVAAGAAAVTAGIPAAGSAADPSAVADILPGRTAVCLPAAFAAASGALAYYSSEILLVKKQHKKSSVKKWNMLEKVKYFDTSANIRW